MINASALTGSALLDRIDEGLSLAYEKLVRKEAKEGGYLVLQRAGAIEKVPAVELLKELEAKQQAKNNGQV